jgi:hypothetical protein
MVKKHLFVDQVAISSSTVLKFYFLFHFVISAECSLYFVALICPTDYIIDIAAKRYSHLLKKPCEFSLVSLGFIPVDTVKLKKTVAYSQITESMFFPS